MALAVAVKVPEKRQEKSQAIVSDDELRRIRDTLRNGEVATSITAVKEMRQWGVSRSMLDMRLNRSVFFRYMNDSPNAAKGDDLFTAVCESPWSGVGFVLETRKQTIRFGNDEPIVKEIPVLKVLWLFNPDNWHMIEVQVERRRQDAII